MPFVVILVGIMAFAIIYTIQGINRRATGQSTEGPGTFLFGAWLGLLTVGVWGLMLLAACALIAVFAPFLLPVVVIVIMWRLFKKATRHNDTSRVYAQLPKRPTAWANKAFYANGPHALLVGVSVPVDGVFLARAELCLASFKLGAGYKPGMPIACAEHSSTDSLSALHSAVEKLAQYQDLSFVDAEHMRKLYAAAA